MKRIAFFYCERFPLALNFSRAVGGCLHRAQTYTRRQMNYERHPISAAWADYESAKRAWVESHPCSTPSEYDAAIRSILIELGL